MGECEKDLCVAGKCPGINRGIVYPYSDGKLKQKGFFTVYWKTKSLYKFDVSQGRGRARPKTAPPCPVNYFLGS
jgi:hypothetical protein